MQYLALDLGNRRIGLASGEPGVPVVPSGYLERRNLRYDLAQVLAAARERNAEEIVVGIPYTLSGSASRQTKLAQGFVRALEKETSLPVRTVDERYTSVEAEGRLRDAGAQPSHDKGSIDSAAAAVILERYLAQLEA